MKVQRLLVLMGIVLGLMLPGLSLAQLASPNQKGVAMGHLHYYVADPEAEKAFWLRLGAQDMGLEGREGVTFSGLIIMLAEGEREEGTEGSVINHVAFRVESLDEIASRGLELEYNPEFPGIASVYLPSGERVELFDDGEATNIGFDLDPGQQDPVAERHNQPLMAEIVTHHLHYYLPNGQSEIARDWYVEHFGGTPGQRWRYVAADFPGMNLNFSEVDMIQAPTQGRTLDHIGFEIVDLESFCKALEASGIVFDIPYRKLDSGLGLAFFIDPWGARIELTEGLSN